MKKYKIDKSKNIGNVIFVVEGGRPETGGTELRLLKRIFSDILEYEVQELRRGSDEFIAHGENSQFRVFALNLPKNQLTQMTEEALDELYQRLTEEFGVKPEDCPIFYLYDRDYLSYKPNELRKSYVMSCSGEAVFLQSYFLGKDIKKSLKQMNFSEENVETEEHLIHATEEMDKGLNAFGIETYDLDNLAPALLDVYDRQQEKQKADGTFSVLSLISMALLELGVIIECEE